MSRLAATVQALVRCRLEEGSPSAGLRRLVSAWLELAERYSYPQLAAQPGLNASDEVLQQQRRVLSEPLIALFERGRTKGEFPASLSPGWAAKVFASLVLTGARAVSEGSLSRDAAPDVVAATLLTGIAGPGGVDGKA